MHFLLLRFIVILVHNTDRITWVEGKHRAGQFTPTPCLPPVAVRFDPAPAFHKDVLMLSAILAPAMALTLSTAVVPSAAEEIVQVHVAISDLNLADPQDRQILERRLNSAAFKVCGRTFGRQTMAQAIEQRNCLAMARASYEDQVRLALAEAGASRVSLRQN